MNLSSRFPVSDRSKVKRLPKRGSQERAEIYAILDSNILCHIAYVIDGQPFVTPTGYWREGERLYWHGSSASRMLRNQAGGLPVCLTVTHFDGLVLALSGFHHSVNYRSVMAFGRAQRIDDPKEKEAAVNAYVERVFPGRNRELRAVDTQELKGTTVLGMTIEEASAKVRTGPPIDDEPDYTLPVWAGVIPIKQTFGAALADPRLTPGIAWPQHLTPFGKDKRIDEVFSATAAYTK